MLKLWCLFIFVFVKYSGGIQPNVLMIIVDDLRQAIGKYGDRNAFTPNMDGLANTSFLFTNAYAQQALCAPSRNSFLTSRRPDSLHLYDFYSYWREAVGNFTTLPQYFKENGYHTYSVGKVFHPGISSNFTDDAPYSWSEIPFHPCTDKYKNAKVCITPDGRLAQNLICPVIVKEQPESTLPDLESLDAALEFIKKAKHTPDKPYFLAIGFHKPHIPFKFPIDYLKYHPLTKIEIPKNHYKPSSLPNVAWNPWLDVKRRDDIKDLNISFPFGRMPDKMTLKIIQSYHASVTYIDDLIGQILKNVDEKTIIVLLGDHGWSMGEHGEFSKFSNFEISTRVPLLIKVPKLSNRTIICNSFVELVDLFPTLVDLAGLKSLDRCIKDTTTDLCTEGRSLVPLMISALRGKKYKGKRAIFYQYPRPGVFPTQTPNSDEPRLRDIKIMGYTIKTKQFRYTEWVGFNHNTFIPNWTETYAVELYDHLFDPDENNNLAGRNELSNITHKLRKMLIKGWRYV